MIKRAPAEEDVVRYVYDQFKLSYESPELSVDELKSLCLMSGDVQKRLMTPSLWKPNATFLYKEHVVPVFFKENINESLLLKGVIQMDVYLNVFLLLSGIQEWAFEERDEHGRFLYKNSLQAKYDFVGVPVVNVYFELLAKTIREKGFACCPKLSETGIVFTHDIDQVRSGWYNDLTYALKRFTWKSPGLIAQSVFIKLLGKRDTYFQGLLTMNQVDEKHKLDCISFLMTKKGHKDADYKIEAVLSTGVFSQKTIGFHPGHGTFQNKIEFAKQFQILKRLFPNCEKVVRQHFLKYEVKRTPKIHESLGVERDYSLGFAEQYGFRNGYAGPFQLYSFEEKRAYSVIEIPLYFMDATLVNYMKDDSWVAKEKILVDIQQLLKDFNCTFSVLFHNSVFTSNRHKDFGVMYEKLAELSKKKHS